jgi:hypothetical protein
MTEVAIAFSRRSWYPERTQVCWIAEPTDKLIQGFPFCDIEGERRPNALIPSSSRRSEARSGAQMISEDAS